MCRSAAKHTSKVWKDSLSLVILQNGRKKIFITFHFFLQVELPVAASAITRPRTTGSLLNRVSWRPFLLLFFFSCVSSSWIFALGKISDGKQEIFRFAGRFALDEEDRKNNNIPPCINFHSQHRRCHSAFCGKGRRTGEIKGRRLAALLKLEAAPPSADSFSRCGRMEMWRRMNRAPLWECRRFLSAGGCRGGWTPAVEFRPIRAAWWRERT